MKYQSFYVSAVAEHDGNCEQIAEINVEYWSDMHAKIFWSVYGYLKPEPQALVVLSNCISDHDTREDAEEIAFLLNEGLAGQ